jgi:nicotinamidase-related amidase
LDDSLVPTDKVFIKHGYLPPPDLIPHLSSLDVERVLVCGLQTDTCVLAAGFALFDAGLHPTLLSWLTVGSSLDRSGELGARLWRHHFGSVLASPTEI